MKCSPCDGPSKLSMLPLRDKGIISLHIQVTFHAKTLDWVVHLWVKGALPKERLRKGCDSSIVNFRYMGAFQNLPNMHANIVFYPSEPPGYKTLCFCKATELSWIYKGIHWVDNNKVSSQANMPSCDPFVFNDSNLFSSVKLWPWTFQWDLAL